MATATPHKLPETGFLRIWDIVGDKKRKTPALIPIGRTTFLNRVKEGIYPKPVRISDRTVAWKVEDIRALINELGGSA
jgi:prophage regulatory protein